MVFAFFFLGFVKAGFQGFCIIFFVKRVLFKGVCSAVHRVLDCRVFAWLILVVC